MQYSRREVLRALGAMSFVAATPSYGRAAPIETRALTERSRAFVVDGVNVVGLRTSKGLVLVDGGPEVHAKNLISTVRKAFEVRKIDTLFNTHWHPEQTGANALLGRGGTEILAHENTRLWLSTDAPLPLLDKTYGPLPSAALPRRTTYTQETLVSGNETIEFGYLPEAHTDGDLYVFFRDTNVLVAGGALTSDRWPIIDFRTGGWIGGLARSANHLHQLANDATKIVPAHGPVMTRAELKVHSEMYQQLFESTIKLLTSGLAPAEAAAKNPTQGMKPEWGDPTTFVLQAYMSHWRHHAPDA
jgi:glyoxylase-like metal-dependent hydrolase (beta-lactamase superfamily II)